MKALLALLLATAGVLVLAAGWSPTPPASPRVPAATPTSVAARATVQAQADFDAAVDALSPRLQSKYGFQTTEVQRLVTQAQTLARLRGEPRLLPVARALMYVVEGSLCAAEDYGVCVEDTAGYIRGVGASYGEMVEVAGRTRTAHLMLDVIDREIGRLAHA